MKMILSILLVAMMGCAHSPKKERPKLMVAQVGDSIQPQTGWLKEVSQWYVNSPGKPYSIQVDPTMSKPEDPALRFEIRKGDVWTGPAGSKTHRIELVPAGFPPINSEHFYSCQIYLPKDFPIEDNRLVLMQWWPETKSELGEEPRSPSLALRYGNGSLSVSIRHSDQKVVTDPESVPQEKIFRSKKLKLGTWNQFTFQVKWSFKKDGFVKFWWNGKLVADYHGPVGYDDDRGPLFKFGMYRDDTASTYVSYFRQCSEGAQLPRD